MSRKPYIFLWLLLSASLIIILLISFTDEIKVGSYIVKKAPYADLLSDKNSGEPTLADVSSDNQNIDSLANLTVVTDSNPQSIFIFGDSMTFNLALRLADYARQNGHKIHSVNWDSSNTKIWAEHDTLAYYLDKYKPTQVFISLGSNELYISKPESRIPYIQKILEVIDTIPYVWIGPPNWKEDGGINHLLEKLCKKGSFFRSAGMEFKRKADKIHPTRESSSLWVDSIMRWLPNSSHPFIASYPSDSIKKSNPNIIFLKALNK